MSQNPLNSHDIGEQRITEMSRRLNEALHPTVLEITNESHKHVGHPGAATGLGHFHLKIGAEVFEGKSRIAAHRLIYEALGEMMQTDIHALSIDLEK